MGHKETGRTRQRKERQVPNNEEECRDIHIFYSKEKLQEKRKESYTVYTSTLTSFPALKSVANQGRKKKCINIKLVKVIVDGTEN